MMVLLVLAIVFLAVQLITLVSNLFFFPELSKVEDFQKSATVSILIPARNEEHNLPLTLSRVLEQNLADEVIVLNDQSTDETAKILAEQQLKHPHLKVIEGQNLAEGWGGKNWACQQLADAATGDILIFTDADVQWQKGTLEALLSFKEKQKAEFLSVWPHQLMVSSLENITISLVDQILLGSLPYLGVRYSKLAAFSAGNGQLMLWEKQAYKEVGQHAAFKDEVLEDVRMGQAAKRAGLRVALAVGKDMISTRMYQTDKDLLAGFSKNIVLAAGSKFVLSGLVLLNILVHTVSWLLILLDPLWFIVALMSLALRLLTNLKTGQALAEIFWQPFVSIPLVIITWRALRQKQIRWKDREYSAS